MERLAGDRSTHFRSTDHSGEIAWLRLRAIESGDRRDELIFLVAADLLESHDETGCSLDHWTAPRNLVELLLGEPILENGV